MKKLIEIASVLRSKNAGPLYITFDIMFGDNETFEKVVSTGVISKELVGKLYAVDVQDVLITLYGIVNSIKITIPRKYVSGDLHDSDIYGCQQHIPLSNILIPL